MIKYFCKNNEKSVITNKLIKEENQKFTALSSVTTNLTVLGCFKVILVWEYITINARTTFANGSMGLSLLTQNSICKFCSVIKHTFWLNDYLNKQNCCIEGNKIN